MPARAHARVRRGLRPGTWQSRRRQQASGGRPAALRATSTGRRTRGLDGDAPLLLVGARVCEPLVAGLRMRRPGTSGVRRIAAKHCRWQLKTSSTLRVGTKHFPVLRRLQHCARKGRAHRVHGDNPRRGHQRVCQRRLACEQRLPAEHSAAGGPTCLPRASRQRHAVIRQTYRAAQRQPRTDVMNSERRRRGRSP